jgi:putative PIN family toxin of toxin-antitoxin system
VKIVLDTNVLVSGLLKSRGNPALVLELALRGAVQVCHDERILAEYTEVLARPRFRFDPRRARDVLLKLQLDGVSFAPPDTPLDLPDPDDEPFLAVALAARADYLVTGNTSDYPPAKRRTACVITPAEFVARWRTLHPEAGNPAAPD